MHRRHFLLSLPALGLAACGGGGDTPADGGYRGRLRTIAMPAPRAEHVSVPLADGRVLLVGGSGGETALTQTVLAFQPAGDTFMAAGTLLTGRVAHSATRLPGERVLVYGGQRTLTGSPLAEVLDAHTGLSHATAHAPAQRRSGHSATALPDGRVLIVGGMVSGEGPSRSAELFDPLLERFEPLASSLQVGRAWHTVVPLGGGRLLVYGGQTASGAAAPPELFDIATLRFGDTPLPLAEATPRIGAVAVRTRGGHAVVVGGGDGASVPLASAVVTPGDGPPAARLLALREGRLDSAAAPLADGRVLVSGGTFTTRPDHTASTELIDPASGLSLPGPRMAQARRLHSASLLPDGRVLIAGGWGADNSLLASAELFD